MNDEVRKILEAYRTAEWICVNDVTDTNEKIRARLELAVIKIMDLHKRELEKTLQRITSRFEREDKGGLKTRDGLAWAMYEDAKEAIADMRKKGGINGNTGSG